MVSVFDAIADGLATHSYAVSDQFLSQTEVGAILRLEPFEKGLQYLKKAGIGRHGQHQVNEAVRGDYIQWVDKKTAPPEVMVYMERVEGLMRHLNETLFLSLKDFEVHVTIYPVGSFYKRHLDQFRKDDHRKLSLVCYLNEGWEGANGGQLRIYLPAGPKDILPLAGRLVCFRSDAIEHEVLPATRERLSLTGWLLDRFMDLKHL